MSLRVSISRPENSDLLRAHVQRRADQLREGRVEGLVGEGLPRRLGDAEVDDLGNRHTVVERDQDVRRLQVAVDDPLLVGVLHGPADEHEQLQPLPDRELLSVAVLGDGQATDQLHDEVGAARTGHPAVVDLGDVRVVHHRQGLPLGLEPGDDLLRVHPRLDDLQGHLAAHGLTLFGHVDDAHAPLADLLHQLVGADDGARLLREARRFDCERRRLRGRLEEAVRPGIEGEEPLDVATKLEIAAGLVQEGQTGLRTHLEGRQEDLFDA